jgi:predicted ATPase/transcriptional regulator with XRE-family HTH domain
VSDAPDREPFGLLLRRHRLDAGLTQESLAERSGVAQRTIQDLERGIARPRRETIRRLIDALGLSPAARAAFDGVGPPPRPSVVHRAAYAPRAPSLGTSAVAQRPPTNLPMSRTRLIGREQEVADIRALLLRDAVGLVTLTGPAGTGKTRLGLSLAAEVMEYFPDGMHFVALDAITSPDLVPAAIAQVLEIRDIGGRPALDSLNAYLRSRRLLLVLDNFEQILSAAPVVSDLLGTSPGLKVLVTSRAPLGLHDEHEWPVPPLALPDRARTPSADALSRFPAVALFVERAVAIRPGFAVTDENAQAVAEICHGLDGLPLAIELAAARVRLLTPQAMLSRLDRRLPLLTGGLRDRPARQQTLRGAITWSHDLLEPDEQRLFRRLAVFVGGFTLEAVEGVFSRESRVQSGQLDSALSTLHSPLDLVESLVAKSLVRQQDEPDGSVRFAMFETIREYASELLDASGELTALRDRHLSYYLAFAEAAKPELQGPRQASWFDRLERENDNLRAALEWSSTRLGTGAAGSLDAVGASARVEAGTRLAEALGFFWVLRGRGRESLPHVMALVALAPPSTTARARAVTVAAHVHGHMLGDYQTAIPFADEGLRAWRVLGDAHGIAVAILRRAQLVFESGDYPLAETLFGEARDHFRELERARDHRGYGPEVPTTLWLAEVAQARGEAEAAQHLYDEALGEARARGDGHAVAHALRELARMWRTRGDPTQALALLRESAAIYVPIKDIRCACILLDDLAGVLCEHDRPHDAARLFGAADALRTLSGKLLTRAQQAPHTRDLAAVERRLDGETFAAAWAEGQAMTLEQAIEYAAAVSAPDRDTASA